LSELRRVSPQKSVRRLRKKLIKAMPMIRAGRALSVATRPRLNASSTLRDKARNRQSSENTPKIGAFAHASISVSHLAKADQGIQSGDASDETVRGRKRCKAVNEARGWRATCLRLKSYNLADYSRFPQRVRA
jgi:hypothetical protein